MSTHKPELDIEMNIEMYHKGMRDALMGKPRQEGNGPAYNYGYDDGISD